jgi:antitoxin component HigA of HigAB toxin-antitoxin module
LGIFSETFYMPNHQVAKATNSVHPATTLEQLAVLYQKNFYIDTTNPKCYNCYEKEKFMENSHPLEAIQISPEALEIANYYLQLQSVPKVCSELGLSTEMVCEVLDRREVKAYMDMVFFDMGFNNRHKMRSAMDMIIQRKFQELDEAGIGSNKDIVEILALSHKMTMEYMDKQIQLEKLRGGSIKNQVNVQINDGVGGSNYGNLIERIINSGGEE